MANIINLRREKRRKAREDREKQAEANRLAHGRSKQERLQTSARTEKETRQLDGHKRDLTSTVTPFSPPPKDA